MTDNIDDVKRKAREEGRKEGFREGEIITHLDFLREGIDKLGDKLDEIKIENAENRATMTKIDGRSMANEQAIAKMEKAYRDLDRRMQLGFKEADQERDAIDKRATLNTFISNGAAAIGSAILTAIAVTIITGGLF